jgi:hypothetical protein
VLHCRTSGYWDGLTTLAKGRCRRRSKSRETEALGAEKGKRTGARKGTGRILWPDADHASHLRSLFKM